MQQKKLLGKLKAYLDIRKPGCGLKKLKDLMIGNWLALKNRTRLNRERKDYKATREETPGV